MVIYILTGKKKKTQKKTFMHVPEMFIHVAIQHSYHIQSSG